MRAMINNGINKSCSVTITLCGVMLRGFRPTPTQGTGQRLKTNTNDKRYKVSGIIQSRGMGEMSVEMYVVVPSIKLVGTAASPTQRSRRNGVTSYGFSSSS